MTTHYSVMVVNIKICNDKPPHCQLLVVVMLGGGCVIKSVPKHAVCWMIC